MKTHITWWNSLGKTKKDDLALTYYGTELLMDDEIEKIHLEEHKYYIEFTGEHYQSVFPENESELSQIHTTITEALDYMFKCGVKEITVKN